MEHVLIRCRKHRAQREMMRNNLREIRVQKFTLKGVQQFTLIGLLSMGERAQVCTGLT